MCKLMIMGVQVSSQIDELIIKKALLSLYLDRCMITWSVCSYQQWCKENISRLMRCVFEFGYEPWVLFSIYWTILKAGIPLLKHTKNFWHWFSGIFYDQFDKKKSHKKRRKKSWKFIYKQSSVITPFNLTNFSDKSGI